jgi:peptidoglycan/LPS O-acetylase OafA/YrhL
MHQRYYILDVLRGKAAMAVLIFHLFAVFDFPLQEIFGLGRYGVTLFFLLSGAVIYITLDRQKNGKLLVFFLNRIFRIVPLFYVVLILIMLISEKYDLFPFLLLGFLEPKSFNKIIGVEWSIYAEVIFYLLAPIIVLRSPRILISTLVFTLLLAIVWRIYFYAPIHNVETRQYLFFQPINNFYNFIAGVLLWRSLPAIKQRLSFNVLLASLIGIMCIVVITKFIIGNSFFMVADILFLILFSYLIIIYTYIPKNLLFDLFASLGTISYSIYLVHYPILILVSRDQITGFRGIDAILGLIIVILTSIITFNFIEKNGVIIGKRITERIK